MEYSFRNLRLSEIIEEARQKDELFITNFTKINPDGSRLCKLKIIPHEDPKEYGKKYWIVRGDHPTGPPPPPSAPKKPKPSEEKFQARNKEKGRELGDLSHTSKGSTSSVSKKTLSKKYKGKNIQKPNQSTVQDFVDVSAEEETVIYESDEQDTLDNDEEKNNNDNGIAKQLLECTLYGELSFLDSGPYGNWVPNDDDNPDDIKYSSKDPNRAVVVISMDVDPIIAESLQIIDDAFQSHLTQTGRTVSTYNVLVRKDRIILKYPLVVALEEWKEYNAESKEQGRPFKGKLKNW